MFQKEVGICISTFKKKSTIDIDHFVVIRKNYYLLPIQDTFNGIFTSIWV